MMLIFELVYLIFLFFSISCCIVYIFIGIILSRIYIFKKGGKE